MSSGNATEPPDRSPEELAAVLADLAAEDGGPAAPGTQPVWRPVGDKAPEIWAVTPTPDIPTADTPEPDDAAPADRAAASEAPKDPLSQLDREVARLNT
jgi:hypothetical protein